MRRDLVFKAILAVSAAVLGWIGWSGYVLALPATALFPFFWSISKTRTHAGIISAAYFLTSSRGLPQGVSTFYSSNMGVGLLLWLSASMAFVIVHAAFWRPHTDWKKGLSYLGACAALALPPFGIVGWAHPVTAAGVVFPGWGWWGLLAMVFGLAIMATRAWRTAAIVLSAFWLLSATHGGMTDSLPSWGGIDLEMGVSLGRTASLERQEELLKIVLRGPVHATVVLPESALGFWTPTLARLWRAKLAGSGITVIAGAALVDESGYDNVLVRITPDDSKILYRERMPVPGAMWQPWGWLLGEIGGARSHMFSNPVVVSGNESIAPLICYELLLVWPILHSMLHQPDAIIAVGNGWWTAGTAIVGVQRANAQAWAHLFGKPLILAFNI